MTKDGKIKINKFDGHDFRFWKIQIEDYLYQKKIHEPLVEAKPACMKAEDRTLLDRQALGVVSLSLAKNAAYNVVYEKTTYGLIKALSNMYKKPSALNKVFLIRQMVNTKLEEGASVADHVKRVYSIFRGAVSGTVTAVSGSTGTTKLTFDSIHDLILREDIRKKTFREYSNFLLSAEENAGEDNHRQRHNTVFEDVIMDYSASFHATFCKEELERFRLRSSKVRLADEKTLDIAGVEDVVLKTSFGTMIGLYTDCLEVGQMSEKHMNILASKGRIPDLQKAVVGFCEPCVLGKQKKANPATMFPLSMTTARRSDYEEEWKGNRKLVSRTLEGYGQMRWEIFWGMEMGHKGRMKQRCLFNVDLYMEPRPANRFLVIIEAKTGQDHVGHGKGAPLIRSEGFRNSGSFEDSESSDEEGSEDVASSEEGGSETSHVRRSIRKSKAPVRFCGGEGDDRELVVMREVGEVLLGGGEGEVKDLEEKRITVAGVDRDKGAKKGKQKEFRDSPSGGPINIRRKEIGVIFNAKGIVLNDFTPRSHVMTKHFFDNFV
ncbi:hypothetical protein Tco_0458843 [Tanacetum coccineum]